jgi:two-component system chemotaxis response regulator CheY
VREAHPDVRVIVITGQSTSDVVSEALKLGANGFVVKPFSADKVLKAIHTALGTA